ncbi:MAG: hypothetical protein Q9163_001314 [Psora crenata]
MVGRPVVSTPIHSWDVLHLSEMSQSTPTEKPTSSPSATINATWLRRNLTLLALRIFRKSRQRRRGPRIVFIPGNICIKAGHFTRLAEAATMQFVAQNTHIPVPKVYCAFKRGEITYIVMEKINGEMLGRQWVPRSEESKARILRQLKEMIIELRSIPAPGDGQKVADVNGGELYDERLPTENHRRGCLGPFEDVSQFHRQLRENLEEHPDHYPENQSNDSPAECGDLASGLYTWRFEQLERSCTR